MYSRAVLALTTAFLSQTVVAQVQAQGEKPEAREYFSEGMARWWVEGGERTWVQDGSLFMKADPEKKKEGRVATAWFRQELPADVRVAFDAQVISSSLGVNNINVFLHYSDPEGTQLYETRERRRSAAYPLYHQLNGYIFTFVADSEQYAALPDEQRPARIRIRRCPGFELLAETYAYHNRTGRTYHVEIVKRGGDLVFSVDDNELLRTEDLNPHQGGLLGLRTYRTYLRWSNLEITSLKQAPPTRRDEATHPGEIR
jgi:hypothetical protein